jgi:hypothetical protein
MWILLLSAQYSQGPGKLSKLYQDMVNGTTEFSKRFFREGIEVVESECGAITCPDGP